MNLQQLKAKYAGTTTTSVKTEAAPTLGMSKAGRSINKAWEATKSATKTTATAMHGVMPATNRRVDSIASQFNDRINNVEAKQWGQDVKIEMLAQLMGANMPSDEELMEAFVQHQQEEEERQKAELKAKIEARKAERLAEEAEKMADVAEPMMQKMFEMFTAMFSKDTAAPADVADEIVEVTDDEIVEVTDQVDSEPESQPESESVAPKGRRRIKRGAPLAE